MIISYSILLYIWHYTIYKYITISTSTLYIFKTIYLKTGVVQCCLLQTFLASNFALSFNRFLKNLTISLILLSSNPSHAKHSKQFLWLPFSPCFLEEKFPGICGTILHLIWNAILEFSIDLSKVLISH